MNPLHPRIKIHDNKQATLAGLYYDDLRSILTAASINFYDSLKKATKQNDTEGMVWYQDMITLMQQTKAAMDQAIADTFPPRPPLTKKERLAAVKAERKERLLLNQILKDILAQRKKTK